ncbi:MAG: 4Fe-4S dicluster domain-containing protein [Bacteroidales bacterium]|jgi:ferredoxin|nr:4Fe-4S dicluster domain-containing protein [Bacteroidales bacterium]
MSQLVNDQVKLDLLKFGVKDWNDCFNCGNCSAICKLTEEGFLFPRKVIKQAQLGLRDSMVANLDPWLCYYCGECSETCPRDANPAEIMMSLRRYLTSLYDWTGLSRKFYTSKFWEISVVIIFFLLVIASFLVFLPPQAGVFSAPGEFINDQGGVMINSLVRGMSSEQFVNIIEWADWIMAIIIGGILISNIIRMFILSIIRDKKYKIPLLAYFTEAWALIYHFVTQFKFSKCDRRRYWFGHFLLMSGYTLMFIFIVTLLKQFQTEQVYDWYHWQRLLGYYATFGILFFLSIATYQRIIRKDYKFRYSHASDWLFIIMLGLTTITGIILHIFRISGMPKATYITYVLHMAVLVPMIIIEVPFSKWSHLAYRPFAIYFYQLKKRARAEMIPGEKLVTV